MTVTTLIITSIISILSNIFLMLLIKLNQTFRKRTFYRLILTLCVSDLSVGLFIIPLRLSYTWEWKWSHGQAVCKMWTLVEFTHCSFSVFILVALCIDRFEAKLSTLRPISAYRAKFVPIALLLLPWVFVVFICVPILIAGEEGNYYPEKHCTYMVKQEFWIPWVVILYGLPLIVLCIVVIVMVIFYNVKRNEWYRIEEETGTGNADMLTLRTSTISALVVSAVTLGFWSPLTVAYFITVLCPRCGINYWTYTTFYIMSWITSAITPFLWLVHGEIRQTFKRIVLPLFHRFGFCTRVEIDTVALDPKRSVEMEENNHF